MRKLFCALAMVAAAGCDWPRILSPDMGAGLTAVNVTVEDQHVRPVSGVRVTLNDWTASGSAFTVSGITGQDGRAIFAFSAPGQRRCEIQLPAGVSPGPNGLVQTVEVIAKETVRARFVVVR